MREEQSPPRAPSPSNNTSNRIKLSPQPLSSPVSPSNPVVVLSPSISRGNSPCRSPTNLKLNLSPNKKCSPRCLSPIEDNLHQKMRNLNIVNRWVVPFEQYSMNMSKDLWTGYHKNRWVVYEAFREKNPCSSIVFQIVNKISWFIYE